MKTTSDVYPIRIELLKHSVCLRRIANLLILQLDFSPILPS